MVLPHAVFPLAARAMSLTPLLVDDNFSLPDTSVYPSTTLDDLINQSMCIHLHPVFILLPARPLSPTPNIPSPVSKPIIFIFSFGIAMFCIEMILHQRRWLLIQLKKQGKLIELHNGNYQRVCWIFQIF